ncbi:MAG: OB-fold domain-containing protein [Polyangiales bacterium]
MNELFFEGTARGELRIRVCSRCKGRSHFMSEWCPYCYSQKLTYLKVSGRGKVSHFTVCHTSPYPEFDQFTPYILALIELEEGVRMMSNVLDCSAERIHVGLPVKVHFETRGPGRTGPDPKDATKPGKADKFVSLPMFVPA